MSDLSKQLHEMQTVIQRIEKRIDQIEQTNRNDLDKIKSWIDKAANTSTKEREKILKTVEKIQKNLSPLAKSADHKTPPPTTELRVGIFVDVQNIFYAAKQFNARLDYEKLLQVGTANRRLIRAMAYLVQSPGVDQSSFISMLQQKSYEVRRKDLRQRSDGSAKGDWDMGMAIDIMGYVNTLDVVVLVSGDGDFVPLVDLVKTTGPRVEVISFTHNTAKDLIHSADTHIPIEETLLLRAPHPETPES